MWINYSWPWNHVGVRGTNPWPFSRLCVWFFPSNPFLSLSAEQTLPLLEGPPCMWPFCRVRFIAPSCVLHAPHVISAKFCMAFAVVILFKLTCLPSQTVCSSETSMPSRSRHLIIIQLHWHRHKTSLTENWKLKVEDEGWWWILLLIFPFYPDACYLSHCLLLK